MSAYDIDGETSDEDTLDNLPVYPEIELTTVYVYWDGEIALSKFCFLSFINWIANLSPHGEYLSVLAEALPRLYKGVASLASSLRDSGFNFEGNDCWLRQPSETSDSKPAMRKRTDEGTGL